MKETKICADCEKPTKNYYATSTNKGKIYKCAECYELNICRELRENYVQNNNSEKE
jgi:hypothetical protein